MLLKLSLNFTKNLRGLSSTLNIFNSIRISGYKTEVFATSNNICKKLTEADLTPVDSEDSEIRSVGDINHKLRLHRVNRPHDAEFYVRLIIRAAGLGDLEKMLSVFFHDMLIKDRFRPNAFIVNILLQKLAELGGHSDAAFKIIKKSIDIKLELSEVTYSLLFKNCSKEIANNDLVMEISNKTVQLVSNEELDKIRQPAIRALQLVEYLKGKNIKMGKNALNSLLFTLNKAGMIKESFRVLDEFLNEGYKPTEYTLSAMLEGCLFDRKSGFGLALLIFNRLVYYHKCNINPHVINSLLKIVKYCQFGNATLIKRVIDSSTRSNQSFLCLYQISSESTTLVPQTNIIHSNSLSYSNVILDSAKKYDLVVNDFINENWSQSNNIVNCIKSPTNMIQKYFNNIFDIQWLQSNLEPADKLACLGGILGIISMLEQAQCKPNMFIFTSLVSCLPYQNSFKYDIHQCDFYVSVLKQLSKYYKLPESESFINAVYKRNNKFGIQDPAVLDMSKFDPFTWSSYSKKCRTSADVDKFFFLLKQNQIVPSSQIIFALMRSVVTWSARLNVLNRMKELGIEFDRALVVFIEEEINKFRKKLVSMDSGEVKVKFTSHFYRFQKYYTKMLDQTQIDAITTGDKKIMINDLPSDFYRR